MSCDETSPRVESVAVDRSELDATVDVVEVDRSELDATVDVVELVRERIFNIDASKVNRNKTFKGCNC